MNGGNGNDQFGSKNKLFQALEMSFRSLDESDYDLIDIDSNSD